MSVVVFGATGPLGRCVVNTALAAGHQVTAFVRTPARLEPHPRLREFTGDVLDASAVAAAVAGHDAVISALGHSQPSPHGHDLHPGASHILAAMKDAQTQPRTTAAAD